jgi:hypothetical protein
MRWLAATAGTLAAAAVGLTVGRDSNAPPSGASDAGGASANAAPSDAGVANANAAPSNAGAAAAAADAGVAPGPAVRAPDAGSARAEAQARAAPRVRRRGNVDYVGDSPGLRIDADAGAAPATTAQAAAPDGGANAPAHEAELRQRIQLLEQQLAATRDQVTELQSMNEQLASLRQQLAESEERRQQAEREAQQRKLDAQQAVSTLYGAQQALANGNGDILDTLSSIEPTLPAEAQREIESARTSIASGDLYSARMHIAAAISAAQRRGD